jgi:hypothetical protein
MANRYLIATLALAAGLGACHKNYDAESPAPAYKASASDSTGRAMAHTVQLQSENNSGITGTAVLTPSGSDTKVTLTLAPPAGGSASGQAHVAHIHTGTCAAPGPVVAPLGTVAATGQTFAPLSKTVNIPAATLMDGQHIVAAHATEADTSPTVACAAISGM